MLRLEDDERIHPHTANLDWRESYYCNFVDMQSDLCGLAWQGVRPNAGVGEQVFLLFDGEKELIRSVNMTMPIAPTIGEERVRMGPQVFECVEPWRHWRVNYDDGKHQVRLDWQQTTSVCDWDRSSIERTDFLSKAERFELVGRTQVEAVVDGRAIKFSGYGVRDRAWGVRNYGWLKFSWWLNAQFPDGSAVHAFPLIDGDNNCRLFGYLHQDGETRGLVSFELSGVTYSTDGSPAAARHMLAADDKGRKIRITRMERINYLRLMTDAEGGQLEDRDPGGREKGRMYLTFQRFTRDDGVVGRGMVDNNYWADAQLDSLRAEAPLYSSLYDFGRK